MTLSRTGFTVRFMATIVNTTLEVRNYSLSDSRSRDPVSDEMRLWFQVTNYVVVCGFISLFGIGANVVNIVVFVRQGFKDSVNISLLGLAIADLACLVTIFWSSICYNPVFENSGLPFNSIDVMYLTGGWPHACFNRVTSYITAFITLERCLCIALPLKVKNIITPLRTKVVIVTIFIAMFIVFSPFYFVNKLEWVFSGKWNRTMVSLVYTKHRETVETITFPIHSVGLSAISLFSVIICTILLVVKLNEKVKWRIMSAVQTTIRSETSTREKKVVKMITIISTVFIVCFVPATAIFFMMAYDPEFSFSGQYKNMFFVAWSVSFVLETVNSSVNIFIYIKMSSKFTVTFVDTFCTSSRRECP